MRLAIVATTSICLFFSRAVDYFGGLTAGLVEMQVRDDVARNNENDGETGYNDGVTAFGMPMGVFRDAFSV